MSQDGSILINRQMAGGESSNESSLQVARMNGATTLDDDLQEVNMPVNFKLSDFNDDEEIDMSEDDEIALTCSNTGNIATEQLLEKKKSETSEQILSETVGSCGEFQKRQFRHRRTSTTKAKTHSLIESDENGIDSKMMLLEGNPNSGEACLEGASAEVKDKTSTVRIKKKGSESFILHVTKESSTNLSSDKAARWLAMTTLIVNVSLAIAKIAATYLSGSLSIISSLVDSAVDITSGLVIWLTARAIRKRDPYMYPRGRTRLEPIALIIVSVIMGVASVQMIVQSLESVIHDTVNPRVDIVSLFIMVAIIFIKFALMILCKKFDYDSSVAVLAQDHWNDCISNTVAIICAWVASNYWIYFDPIGAIAVSIYIATTWFFTGKEHLAMLSGKSAEPEFINRIVKVCVEHDKRIDYIETVYVYHFGTRFLVEVHIVLNPNMTLRESHDISEALQTNIESLAEVERAFVHCDYEYDHLPADEHKVV
ncbi:Metal tolerance protein 7 [Dirofilaria immitis]|nr:Metal tolerance protein 7 [Dirofilaria immitis]